MQATSPQPIRILLVSADEFLRLGLRTVIQRTEEAQMDAATTTLTAVHTAVAFRPHVILVDATLDGQESLSTCRAILSNQPNANVLLWVGSENEILAAQAYRLGVKRCIPRTMNSAGLMQVIRQLANDLPIEPDSAAAHALNTGAGVDAPGAQGLYARLTPQEQRLLPLVAQGLINREIAAQLGLSEKTVKNYLTSMYIKLGICRRTEAVRFYIHLTAAPSSLLPPAPESAESNDGDQTGNTPTQRDRVITPLASDCPS